MKMKKKNVPFEKDFHIEHTSECVSNAKKKKHDIECEQEGRTS